jgi:hypothetical protein
VSKIILHLCADVGSDSYPYQIDPDYEVIRIGKDIGVENYTPPANVHGIIANPVCREFSAVIGFDKMMDAPDLTILHHCQRIISEANPAWWVIENPYNGSMKRYLGKPVCSYEPWMYGSPWTKRTALWGKFRMPMPTYTKWGQVPNRLQSMWIRSGRNKPTLVYQHKSLIHQIPEFTPFVDSTKTDNDFRSLCSQGFARAFKNANP